MKKILILFLLVLTGCSYNFNIPDDITEAKYNGIEIIESDYNKLKNLINKSNFNSKKNNEIFNNTLTIKTKKDMFTFKLSDNYVNYDNYYASNKDLIDYLKNIKNQYYDDNFFDISHTNSYTINNNDTNILLDNTDSYIILKTNKNLKDFKINLEEFNGHDYDDIDLLYSKDETTTKTVVIRKDLEKSIIKISFKNPYNYKVSIIVKKENDKTIFNKIYK